VTTGLRPMTESPPTGRSAASIADVAERLMGEYELSVSPAMVSDVVLRAHRDLAGQVPGESLAEMLYRLARERLDGVVAGE